MPTQRRWVPPSKAFLEAMSKPEVMECLPARYVGTHLCFNNPLLKYPVALFHQAMLAIYGVGGGTSDSNSSATSATNATSTNGGNTGKTPCILRIRSHYGTLQTFVPGIHSQVYAMVTFYSVRLPLFLFVSYHCCRICSLLQGPTSKCYMSCNGSVFRGMPYQ